MISVTIAVSNTQGQIQSLMAASNCLALVTGKWHYSDCLAFHQWRQVLFFYLSVNVFSTKVLIGDTIFLRLLMETGPPFYVVIRATRKSRRLQCKGSIFISQLFLRPWVLVRPRESNTRPPALQSSALPTEVILPLTTAPWRWVRVRRPNIRWAGEVLSPSFGVFLQLSRERK